MKRVVIIIFLILLSIILVFTYRNYEIRQEEHSDHITLYGNVDIRQVDLGFRVSGRIEKMSFEEGDLIPANTFIASLDKQPYEDQVTQAQAKVESIQASLKNAERLADRRKELLGTGAISNEDYEDSLSSIDVFNANIKEAQAAVGVAKTQLNDTEIFSPNEGTILTRIREPGAIVKQADPIYTLSLTTPIWIRAYISEPELGLIFPGMAAEITTDTTGSIIYHGHIGFISPVAEFTPKTVETSRLRTDLVYRLRIIVDNPDRGLRQGMPVTVKLLKKSES